ncbi:IclR family transcriptional regulator [Pelagicoccus sp. SDUM812002]|uniref:IclR family transcriptional regulator n=1 Tax=Pelagicoccus sp. SDUM812002 TaxID=3041266 RepID=UPI00280F9953|nr:IclR family transcriptional regulator [Pelagicoccus sp. SDUM812002]MDQ8188369.1 IclR family transcriptional regulator [Pelagicoccus sp. SDUM812002]
MPEYSIPNLRNACRLLRHLGEQEGAMSVTELAEELKLPRTSALRIVKTLEAEGFLQGKGSGYQLGGALAALGMKAASHVDLRAAARPLLEALTAATEETCHLAVWDDGRALIVEVSECLHPLSAASRPGTRAYVHASATGKTLLANNFLDRLGTVWGKADRISLTPKTITSVEVLKRELVKVLRTGYAVDDEEYHVGVRCVAAPVFDSEGRVCAGLGLTASSGRFTKRRTSEFAAKVQKAAADLSRLLGWQG